MSQQGLDELELPQFATTERDNIFVEKRLKLKQRIEILLKLAALCRVFTCQRVGFLEQFAHIGRFIVYVVLVPSLLQIVGSVGSSTIGVAESNIAYAATRQLLAKLVNIFGFSTSVAAYDGDYFLLFRTLS